MKVNTLKYFVSGCIGSANLDEDIILNKTGTLTFFCYVYGILCDQDWSNSMFFRKREFQKQDIRTFVQMILAFINEDFHLLP